MTTNIKSIQAEEMALQAELVCEMLELYPNELSNMQVLVIAALLKKLTGGVASYLIEFNSQKQ